MNGQIENNPLACLDMEFPFNPLNPKIKIENLIYCSYTFSIEVVRRIC